MNENKGNAHRSTVSRPSHHGIQSTGGSKRWNSIDRQTSPQNRIVGFLWMPPYTQVVSLDFAKRDRTNKTNNNRTAKRKPLQGKLLCDKKSRCQDEVYCIGILSTDSNSPKCVPRQMLHKLLFFLNQLRQLGVDTAVARHAISK